VLTTPNAIDTMIAVETVTIDYDIPAGCEIVFGYRQTVVSERVRANIFQMKGNAPNPETAGDYLLAGEFVFYDKHAYFKSPYDGFLYKFNGAKFNP